MTRVGFIGLGNMGAPIARRLVQAGLDPIVFDQSEAALQKLAEAGARTAASCAGVAAEADMIGVCVRDDADVEAAVLGVDGVLGSAKEGSLVALHSTILPTTVSRVAAAAAERGVGVVDATVTGGAMGAEKGQLTYMVGGAAEDVERCRPVFEASAKTIIHTGALGSGATAKLCLSITTYLGFLAAFEATMLATKAGVAAPAFENVLRSAGVMTDNLAAFVRMRLVADERSEDEALQAMLRNFTDLAEKDLATALTLAREQGVALPGAGLCQQLMARVYGVKDENRR